MTFELTEKALMEMAGWKVMKEARGIWRAGAVREASWEGGVLEGKVKGTGKSGVARLRIHSKTDVENECGCYLARKFGTVCPHVVAVGLEVLNPRERKEAEPREREAAAIEVSENWPRWTFEEAGEARAVRLAILLPLNLEKSWQAGQLMIGVEVEEVESGAKAMLSALPKGELLFVSEADAGVLEALQAISPQEVPGMGFLTKAEFLDLLDGLGGHGRVSLGKKEKVLPGGRLDKRPALMIEGKRVGLKPDGVLLVDESRAWLFLTTSGRPQLLPLGVGLRENLRAVFTSGISLADAGREREELARHFDLSQIEAQLPVVRKPRVHLVLEGSLNHLEAELSFDYAPEGDISFLPDEESERVARAFLAEWGFEKLKARSGRGETGNRSQWVMREKDEIVRFHAYGRERVPADWEVQEGERFRHAAGQVVEVTPEMDFRGSGEDWFEVSLAYRTSNGNALNAAEVQRIFQGGEGGQRTLPDGRVVVMEEAVALEIAELQRDLEGRQVGAGVMKVDAAQSGYLREAVREGLLKVAGRGPWQEEEWEWDLGPAGDILRPYQREGVEWMLKLAESGLGGILADDMGLGKTLQTLTFIYATGGQSLVVCPSSLVGNWVAEAEKFFPTMNVLAVEGPKRKQVLAKQGEAADVLITSYALLRQDIDTWKQWGFTAIILDEAQAIKNPEAQVSKATFLLSGERRFALTGTPVENSVKDLWSIMRFVQPGYLGKRSDFAERYEKPLAKGDDPALRARLARRMKPFILRRLKSEVATELPEKIEQVHHVTLGKRQRQVYEAILRESRQRVGEAEGGAKRMVALTSLLRLRQACCDLRLTGLEEEEAGVKIAVLEELLEEAIEGGHRILIFSQFVKFLQAMVPMLAAKGWNFCYLDGSTKDRTGVVKRFQEDESIPIFLISLKAGGVGLNLTGADTVIHVDPWWNPAVEAQATDRAYRIGQTRVVTSYKLIARDTVEEKILALQEKKRGLIESLVDGGGSGAGISEQEVLDILES
ncbi:MAG: DEAD/DEAH box helicase [Verrucomicrobiota bacterium JB023]|nr:DEAD/DEAH box helicase [Verrucomicrobiota bacterium JB023]